MGKAYWEHYSHPADMGIRGVGPTKEEAFAQAAMALTAIITDLDKIEPHKAVEMLCVEEDDGLLLFKWLGTLLYEMGTQNMLFGRFHIEMIGSVLQATAWGEEVDVAKHEPAVEVKAATYADLKVHQDDEGNWIAQCIVDV